jgi:7-carboxy-7-deazaguanine synthase
MRIADIFYSIQGEGLLAGVPSAFVRTSGCNLRCGYCDTPYTSWEPEGESLSVGQILDAIASFATRHVVVTGGEPLIAPEIEALCSRLRERGYHITVETAATVFKPIACDLASLSPKLRNSVPRGSAERAVAERHDRLRWQPDVVASFMKHSDYQLKIVIEKPQDVDEWEGLLAQLPAVDRSRVLLMPLGIDQAELNQRGLWLVDECKRRGFRFCPRLHIELYGNRRGT